MSTKREQASKRKHMGELMDLLVEEEHLVFYPPGDVRVRHASEIQTENQLHKALDSKEFIFDCSQTVEIISVVAGLDWPRRMVNGYTGTILQYLPNYQNPSVAMMGALVVFGKYPGHHVCMVKHKGLNPLLYSHGANKSSHYISLSAEKRFHPSPVTFCAIAGLI